MSATQLTPKQRKTIAALLETGEISAAAEAANVSRSTVYLWLKDATFTTALNAAEADALRGLTRQLLRLGTRATDVIESTMADPDATPAVRLKAADTVLARLLQLRELVDLETRITALEASLAAAENAKGH